MRLPIAPVLPVETSRLVLRAFRADDLEALLAIQSDPDSVRYVPYQPRDRQTIVPVLERKIKSVTLHEDGDLLELAVDQRVDGSLIGDVMLALRSVEHETLEVGYIFSSQNRRRGYASEAVRALLDLAFGELGARRVIARVEARNASSLALLDRLGLRREAHLVENEWFKGELSSEVDFGLLAREWNLRSGETRT